MPVTNEHIKKSAKPDYIHKEKSINSFISFIISITLLIAAFFLSLLFSDEIAFSVSRGLSLCVNVIIPSVFPFMIIADLIAVSIDFSTLRLTGMIFEKLFKINREGISAYLLGILCGFPLGVKRAVELYKSGSISKDEAERLIGFSNNTGPAFLVSGIGLGLRGSAAEGILLYLAMLLSGAIVGILFGIGKKFRKTSSDFANKCNFSFTYSIKNAGENTLTVCSYLTFFACICGLLRKILGENILYILIVPFLEVGNATGILSKAQILGDLGSLTLSAFAIGFSGFSVHLQALSFLGGTDISTKRYFLMKLLQGAFSAIIVALLHEILL